MGARSDAGALQEQIEILEQRVFLAAGQLVDLLDAPQEPAVLEERAVLDVLEAEQLVGRRLERLGEGGDEDAVEPQLAALVVRDERLREAELLGQLGLRQALALSELLQALADLLFARGSDRLPSSRQVLTPYGGSMNVVVKKSLGK